MVFNLWLAAIVYHVYGTCKKVLDIQILEMKSLLPIKTTFITVDFGCIEL